MVVIVVIMFTVHVNSGTLQITRGEKRTDPETNEATYWYGVHFLGFNKSHDQWLEESQIMKYDVSLITGGTSAAADEARRKAAQQAEARRQRLRLAEIPTHLRLRIPPKLKETVLNDHRQIAHQGCTLPLPRDKYSKPLVVEIINEWKESRIKEDEESRDSLEEIATKLITYFNLALRHLLLYDREVPLCDKVLAEENKDPSEVYGAEHLMRLLVKLPELVPVTAMMQGQYTGLVIELEDALMDLMSMMAEEETYERLFSSRSDYTYRLPWVPLAQTQPLPTIPQMSGAGRISVAGSLEGIAEKA